MTPEEKVHHAAWRAEVARKELEVAIREARTGGITLRAIAAAALLSHEQVRRICSQ